MSGVPGRVPRSYAFVPPKQLGQNVVGTTASPLSTSAAGGSCGDLQAQRTSKHSVKSLSPLSEARAAYDAAAAVTVACKQAYFNVKGTNSDSVPFGAWTAAAEAERRACDALVELERRRREDQFGDYGQVYRSTSPDGIRNIMGVQLEPGERIHFLNRRSGHETRRKQSPA